MMQRNLKSVGSLSKYVVQNIVPLIEVLVQKPMFEVEFPSFLPAGIGYKLGLLFVEVRY